MKRRERQERCGSVGVWACGCGRNPDSAPPAPILPYSHTARLFTALLLLALTGCPRSVPQGAGPHGELTPDQYQLLSDREQIHYKDITLRIPNTFGGVSLPTARGAYPTILDRVVHTGDIGTLMGLYNQSLFELEHPRVKIDYINFDMWGDNFRSSLAVALSANRAPAYYVARNLPETINQGMYADLTPLMQTWDQFDRQPQMAFHAGKVNGRIYTMAQGELSALIIRYRKDWFREAGIFNEYGEPGPRSDWTWEDFRRIAKKLTDPSRNRYGFAGETGDFQFNQAYGLDPLYIPDPTGKHTWIFNDRDPLLIESLQEAREMVNVDKSVDTSVSMEWFQWHQEFDASHAGMIVSWAAHPPHEALDQPYKFGKDKPFADTVGMAVLPHGPTSLSGLRQWCNLVGFDPTLKPDQLKAAFDWVKADYYGDVFMNNIREQNQDARVHGRRSSLYATMLALPYQPKENPLDEPLSKVFPPDYLRTYQAIRESHYPPLPREFGLGEPPEDGLHNAVQAMYSEAIRTNVDLKQVIAKTANVVNTNLLNFKGPDDKVRLRRFIDATTDFYQRYFPRYYETEWKRKLATYYRVP